MWGCAFSGRCRVFTAHELGREIRALVIIIHAASSGREVRLLFECSAHHISCVSISMLSLRHVIASFSPSSTAPHLFLHRWRKEGTQLATAATGTSACQTWRSEKTVAAKSHAW